MKRAAASTRSMGQVRIILTDDLPNGKAYRGDVVEVKAGYARNYLIPQKKALYAVRQNFERLGMKDPDHESPQQRAERLVREGAESDDHDLKAADQLKHYLRNKVVCNKNLPCGMCCYYLTQLVATFANMYMDCR